ncbi:MAG TPA: mevalonate kinase [Myxococcaceae bacterium]|nr:mevalonate kinase [Myxococcaceae bacterium]
MSPRSSAARRAAAPARAPRRDSASTAFGPGKVILLGEHAVVYGHPALAVPLTLGITARAAPAGRCELAGLPELSQAQRRMLDTAFETVAEATGRPPVRITVDSTLPVSMGLGSSAALAVAVSRCLLAATGATPSPSRVLALALRMEETFHGTPSGVDHTVSAHGAPLLYRRADPARPGRPGRVRRIRIGAPATLVLGLVGPRRGTQETVAALRRRAARWPGRYGRLFTEMGRLAVEGTRALERGDLEELGDAMNVNHGLLAAAGVSSPALDTAVDALRRAGALGAKLTGAGGDGGAVVALFRKAPPSAALEQAGLTVLTSVLEPTP